VARVHMVAKVSMEHVGLEELQPMVVSLCTEEVQPLTMLVRLLWPSTLLATTQVVKVVAGELEETLLTSPTTPLENQTGAKTTLTLT